MIFSGKLREIKTASPVVDWQFLFVLGDYVSFHIPPASPSIIEGKLAMVSRCT